MLILIYQFILLKSVNFDFFYFYLKALNRETKIRMFEIARIALERQAGTKVVAGWMSPVSDGYRKKGLGKNDFEFE